MLNKEINEVAAESIFRQATVADLEQLRQLALDSYGQYKDLLGEKNWKAMQLILQNINTYQDLLNVASCFVCEKDNELIGMAFLVPSGNPTNIFSKEWSYIRLLGVHPRHEGNGTGRKLTQMCVDLAGRKDEKVIALHTSEFQDAARHIYESMGFKKYRDLNARFGKRFFLYTLNLNNSSKAITFHRAGPEDTEVLVEHRIMFAVELSGPQPMERVKKLKVQMKSFFDKAAIDNTCITYIARSGDKIAGIGSVAIRELPGNFKNPSGKWGYIMNMYTLPAFRRKGVCSGILNALIRDAAQTGVTAFELHATKEGELVYGRENFELHNEPTYRRFIHTG
jgi:GNAT superfamily N-acetyltransferase